ncbi:hypothetical protein BH20ACT11_BH20ACT11_16060 [soil metagenome]
MSLTPCGGYEFGKLSDMGGKKNESKQKTPKGQKIPVPKRSDFFRNLKKIAKPDSSGERRPKE